MKITSARFDIEVDEERAVRLIHPLYKAYRSGPIVKGRDAVQWKHIPQGMRGGEFALAAVGFLCDADRST